MSISINFFTGSQVSSTERMDEKKSRFGELSTEDIQEIMDNAAPVLAKALQNTRLD